MTSRTTPEAWSVFPPNELALGSLMHSLYQMTQAMGHILLTMTCGVISPFTAMTTVNTPALAMQKSAVMAEHLCGSPRCRPPSSPQRNSALLVKRGCVHGSWPPRAYGRARPS